MNYQEHIPLHPTLHGPAHTQALPLNFFSNPFKTKLLRETFHTLFFISDETVVGLEAGMLLHLQDKTPEEVPRTPSNPYWPMITRVVL